MEGKQYKAHLMYTWGEESWEYSFVLSEGFKNVDIILFVCLFFSSWDYYKLFKCM